MVWFDSSLSLSLLSFELLVSTVCVCRGEEHQHRPLKAILLLLLSEMKPLTDRSHPRPCTNQNLRLRFPTATAATTASTRPSRTLTPTNAVRVTTRVAVVVVVMMVVAAAVETQRTAAVRVTTLVALAVAVLVVVVEAAGKAFRAAAVRVTTLVAVAVVEVVVVVVVVRVVTVETLHRLGARS